MEGKFNFWFLKARQSWLIWIVKHLNSQATTKGLYKDPQTMGYKFG